MPDINSFFSSRNTVKNLSDSDTEQTSNYLWAIEAFARTTYNSVYVIDYQKKGFEYVSGNPLFLCGHTAEEVKQMGYNFYFNYVPEEDLELLIKINTVGFDFYEKILPDERKEYTISYDFHLKTDEGKKILINQKLTPLFLNEEGKIWKAVCIVSLSTQQSSGNITINKNKGNESFKYDLNADTWRTLEKIVLTDREKEILQYSLRGYAIIEIAENIFISPDTVKFHRKKIFEKFNVANISEAISYATTNKLL